MTNSTIEKAARAHYEKTTAMVAAIRPGNDFLAWDALPEEQRRIAMAGMQAAFSAIREPNEAMLDHGANADGWRHPSSDYISAVKRATVMWRTMIDSILKEGT